MCILQKRQLQKSISARRLDSMRSLRRDRKQPNLYTMSRNRLDCYSAARGLKTGNVNTRST
jgi:hypothetical protein